MIGGRSPPKHRHDGTSPLPLGMDWSPPPKIWNGRHTVWPHDPRTGWSYCVTIPSWVAVPKSRSGASDPVVFYRVQMGIQSPEGVISTRGVLRRFNDFLKLFSDLKKAFPRKILPFAPPKGLMRMKSRELLEERRSSLEEWMSKLLSDIDISRSMVVASFLELEPAVRSSLREATQQPSEANLSATSDISSHQIHPSPSFSGLGGSSSIASDYGCDTAYETSELGSPCFGRDDSSELGLQELTPYEDLANLVSMSSIDEGLLMGKNILDQIEGFRKHKMHARHIMDNGNVSKLVPSAVRRAGSLFEGELEEVVNNAQKCSIESIGGDAITYKGSEMLNSCTSVLLHEASFDLQNRAEGSKTMMSPGGPELQFHSVGQITLPRDQQPKLARILMIMHRRLVTAKTDMEELIMRLNQETAVKEYLMTKVKDLEVELEATKEKGKENFQQALSLEKERITKMQWDMAEFRWKSLEMELKLKSQEVCFMFIVPGRLPVIVLFSLVIDHSAIFMRLCQDDNLPAETTGSSTFSGNDELLRELEATKGQLSSLLEQHAELEMKSKSDVKVLVKEVKSLRRSQHELKQKLDKSLQEKSELEQLLEHEIKQKEQAVVARRKLLHDCQTLHSRLRDCNVKFVDSNFAADSSSTLDVLDVLSESDKQIGLLITEISHLTPEVDTLSNNNDMKTVDHELRRVLGDIFIDNARLRKWMNLFIQSGLQLGSSTDENSRSSIEECIKTAIRSIEIDR